MYDIVLYLPYSLVSLSSHSGYISVIYSIDLDIQHGALLNLDYWVSHYLILFQNPSQEFGLYDFFFRESGENIKTSTSKKSIIRFESFNYIGEFTKNDL